MKIEFNINETVEVVLTEVGAKIYNEEYEQYDWRLEKKVKGDNLRSQLWCLMQLFGPHIALGREVPFEGAMITISKETS